MEFFGIFKNIISKRNDILKEKLNELVLSDRYTKSDYVVQIANGKYCLKHTTSGKYVDLIDPNYTWGYGTTHTYDCFGVIGDIIYAFDYRVPNIEPLNVEKEF